MFPVGRKQPRNQHQNPVHPYIPQALPRFQDSGKKWTVDVGAVMKEKKEQYIGTPVIASYGSKDAGVAKTRRGVYMPDMHGGAVLSVSRNNQAPYGKRSHYGKWDGTMRLPIINPYHKKGSLHRIPAKALKSTRAPMPTPFNPQKAPPPSRREGFSQGSGTSTLSNANVTGPDRRYVTLGGERGGGKTYTPFSGTANGASGGFKSRNNTLFGLEKKLIVTPDTHPSTTNIPRIVPIPRS